jgi:hypothetical protein
MKTDSSSQTGLRSRLTKPAALISIACAALLSLSIAACGDDDDNNVTTPALPAGVEALRASLEPFSSPALSRQAGYTTALTDCMSHGDLGAMGIHIANAALLDGTADPLRPEALIYEPGNGGEMSLVGVEFIVPFAAVPKTAAAPELFGQKFSQNDVFGVWALHVWTTRSNPSGLFAPWNPRVHC